MMELLRKSRGKALVAALYAVAMLALGFAHHQRAAVSPGAELAALVLQDGGQIPLCASGENGSGAPTSGHAQAICDACLLTAAPGAPAAPPVVCAPARLSARLAIVAQPTSAAKAFVHAPQSRGPPQA